MNRADRGVLVGMVLGDGHLNVRRRLKDGKYEYESAELRVVHSIKQLPYAKHKAELVRRIFGGQHSVREFTHAPPAMAGRSYQMCGFSKSNKYFKTLRGMMYPGGRKQYTEQILRMLTPEGIAIWYMDDGHARRYVNKDGWVSSIKTDIATQCSESEVNTIIDYFREEHGVTFKARRDPRMQAEKQWFLSANTENSKAFARVVLPYMHPSMLYKVAHVADLSVHECQTPRPGEDIVRPTRN